MRQTTTPLLLAVQASEFQLRLCTGNDHPTVTAYMSAKVSFSEFLTALDNGRVRDRDDDEKSECEILDDGSASAYSDFVAAAEAWNSG